MTIASAASRAGGIGLPVVLLAGLLVLMGLQTNALVIPTFRPAVSGPVLAGPATVVIAPRAFEYRASGDFVRGTATVDGPLVRVDQPPALEIMKFEVSAADYARCVAEGACRKAEPRRRGAGDVPATGVSFDDAEDYAAWLSGRTGETWRLPTVEEWTFAAGSKAVDHALGIETDAADPAQRWLLAYAREAALSDGGPVAPMPLGSFGENEFGVADLSAVVWEWTSTCASRTVLDAGGTPLTHLDSCGVRYLEGRHRTQMSTFVNDAVGGGCSAGVPPDNLGFRLVRQIGGA